MPDKYLILLGGPTGVGKTNVALQLARHWTSEIIGADSRQVYAELNVGVGKPSAAEVASIPHHLIGYVSIHQPYSVGQYIRDALSLIEFLFTKHKILILSGGTGLYMKAVMEGLDPFPDIPESFVQKWTRRWKTEGLDPLVQALARLDPEYLNVVDQSNPMRLIRALAVSECTGKPYSSFRSNQPSPRDFEMIPLVLDRPRTDLYARIDQRVANMLREGWLEEARALYPFKDLKALNTVGYKELFKVIEGQMTLPEATVKIQQSTRQYAKRQLTWWRNQGQWTSFNADDVKGIIEYVQRRIEKTKE